MSFTDPFDELRKHYADLHDFAVRLRDVAISFRRQAQAGRFPERGNAFAYDRNDPADPLNRSIDITREFEFLVAVTGAFSSGKSTLLNVLLECPDLLPASAIPLTAVCTVIRHGAEPEAEVHYVSTDECIERVNLFFETPLKKPLSRLEHLHEALEKPENFAGDPGRCRSLERFARLILDRDALAAEKVVFEDRYRFICGGGSIREERRGGVQWRHFIPTPAQEEAYLAAGGAADRWVTPEQLALIRDVSLRVDAPILENDIAFLDLPGLNCREDYHRRAVRAYCNMADCVVVTAFQPGNQADEEVVRRFRDLSSNYRDKLFFVFNRVDQFQLEPDELVRSLEYLARDCVGGDFPPDRCFLTSAYLARERLLGHPRVEEELERLRRAFAGLEERGGGHTGPDALGELLRHAAAPEDPGGVGYLRECLRTFLTEDAYRTKIEEITANLGGVVDRLRSAASPRYEDVLRIDEREILMNRVLGSFQRLEFMAASAVHRFRYDYLRSGGTERGAGTGTSLARDLEEVLERVHRRIREQIERVLDQPIRTPPPREDPVCEFDLRRIGDDASRQLRRDFQEITVSAVVDCVRQRFYERLGELRIREHLEGLLAGAPEHVRRFEAILERFDLLLRHSMLCKVRERFHAMPGGKDLRRLDRRVSLAEMKGFLVRVFSEFYPDWIYQHVYPAIQGDLWLAFFLDAEELELEIERFFESAQGALTAPALLESVRIPEEFSDISGDLFEVAALCRRIEKVCAEYDELRSRSSEAGTGRVLPVRNDAGHAVAAPRAGGAIDAV